MKYIKTMKIQCGLSLIMTMVVIAIIGILAEVHFFLMKRLLPRSKLLRNEFTASWNYFLAHFLRFFNASLLSNLTPVSFILEISGEILLSSMVNALNEPKRLTPLAVT
jgi:hypothetical protein